MAQKDFTLVSKNLRAHGFDVTCFDTAADAVRYLDTQLDGQTIGFGGSMTLEDLGLYDVLGSHNTIHWHQRIPQGSTSRDVRMAANAAPIYISSVNGLAETGEIVNIDGTGNRVASLCYGHKKVYLVVGENKLAPDYDAALYRARNVASPKNARRFGVQTPCAAKADRCYDCKSPQRICRTLSVLWDKPLGCEYEVILIRQELGY